MKPRFSIVTISYNQARYLDRALRSVLEQDYPHLEYIVIDPGSTDGSRDIIERYRSRIAHIVFERDAGSADGLNKGFGIATGSLFGFVNSDDALLPGAISRVVDAFERYPDADVISGHGYMIDTEGRVIRRFYSDQASAAAYAHRACFLMQQSTFFKREAFERTRGFDTEAKIWWDGELFLEMCLAGCKFRVVDDFWSIFTIHGESLSGQELLDLRTERARKHQLIVQEAADRVYRKAMGRPMSERARLLLPYFRALRILRHPFRTTVRLLEKAGVPLDRDKRFPIQRAPGSVDGLG